MERYLAPVYGWARRWSRIGTVGTLILLALIRAFTSEISLSIQLIIALIALLCGIPHGAIDHLIAIPSTPRIRFLGYIIIYIAIALLAGWCIASWNLIGFQLVLLMSALHFGFGDASYINEERDAQGVERNPFWVETLYALPAGFLPVMLPLTDHRTLKALNRIHPTLDHWAGSHTQIIRMSVLLLALIAIIVLAITARLSLAVDLLLLALLSIFAPPLIAFATYFGFWHALRHTARLVPKLSKADALANVGRWRTAIWAAIIPGLYAIAGTVGIALLLMVFNPGKFSSSLLWSTLVIIWSLTVPHMMTTAGFDWRALGRKSSQ